MNNDGTVKTDGIQENSDGSAKYMKWFALWNIAHSAKFTRWSARDRLQLSPGDVPSHSDTNEMEIEWIAIRPLNTDNPDQHGTVDYTSSGLTLEAESYNWVDNAANGGTWEKQGEVIKASHTTSATDKKPAAHILIDSSDTDRYVWVYARSTGGTPGNFGIGYADDNPQTFQTSDTFSWIKSHDMPAYRSKIVLYGQSQGIEIDKIYISETDVAPDDPGSGGNGSSDNVVLSVASTGPVISGTTQNVDPGRWVMITKSGVTEHAAVQPDGSWSKDMSGVANLNDGDTLNIYVNNGSAGEGNEDSDSIIYQSGSGGGSGSAISVNGNLIILPNDGWYQIQDATDYTQIYQGNGGTSVQVANGTYNVINLTSGLRTEGVVVPQ